MTKNIICCPSGTNYDSTVHSECPCVNCWADRAAARLKGDNRDRPPIVEVVSKPEGVVSEPETIEPVAQGASVAAAVKTECEVSPDHDAGAKPKLNLVELVGDRQVASGTEPAVKPRRGWASWLSAGFSPASVEPELSEAKSQRDDDKRRDHPVVFDPRIRRLSPGIFIDDNTGRTYTEGQLDLLVHRIARKD
jgi:hypothetical protein